MAVHIISIHDATPDGKVLAVDLSHVLAAIGEEVARLRFVVRELDAIGAGAPEAQARVDAAGARGLWLSCGELVAMFSRITQSIDAEIVAYPEGTDPATLADRDLLLATFPTNRMVLAILAVDSSSLEVYAKDPHISERVVARFRDVRREDPADYF